PIASDINNKLNFWYMVARNNYAKMFENGPVIKEALNMQISANNKSKLFAS
ncbi:4933_t:CDS:1, partial [Gigaspora margarita]